MQVFAASIRFVVFEDFSYESLMIFKAFSHADKYITNQYKSLLIS